MFCQEPNFQNFVRGAFKLTILFQASSKLGRKIEGSELLAHLGSPWFRGVLGRLWRRLVRAYSSWREVLPPSVLCCLPS